MEFNRPPFWRAEFCGLPWTRRDFFRVSETPSERTWGFAYLRLSHVVGDGSSHLSFSPVVVAPPETADHKPTRE
jgi:hypothetical protein